MSARTSETLRRGALLARAAVGLFLAFRALLFLLHGSRAFARLGFPDSAPVALASAEIASGVLFAIPRTAAAGGVGLMAVLAWAAGFHFALRQSAGPLYAFGVAVLALLTMMPAGRRAEMP